MRNFWSILLLVCALCVQGQEIDDIYAPKTSSGISPSSSAVKQQKSREQQLKQRVDSLGHAKAAQALERGYWVLLADRINVGQMSYTATGLNPNSNFVFQQSQEGLVQTAYNQADPGFNGMGGITLAGHVGNVRLRTDKKGNLYYSYSLVGEDINAQVDVTVYAGSDYAQAIVQPIIDGPRLTFNGRLVPYIRPRD